MMFKQITIAIALSAALSSPAFAHGDGDGHCKDTQLGSIMKEMSDDLKSYVSAFKRNDQATMQAQLTKLLANSAKSKDEIPLKLQQDMPGMKDMKDMDHSDMPDMKDMKGMDHSTHMQHLSYQRGMGRLTQLLNQLQGATSKSEVKTLLGNIKQHIKKSHKTFRLDCS